MGMRMSKVVLVVSGELLRESFFPPLPLKWRGFQKGTCVNALTGITDSSLYTANKGAVHALARALAAELIDRGIRVNTISIGPTATQLLTRSGSSQEILQAQDVARISHSPIKRLGQPEEVAKVALFLASDASSFVIGSEIAADGGWLLNII
jgi:NAD(P)-dependent dehydrogenase (short-subunit alcohol dehydrogenase family)